MSDAKEPMPIWFFVGIVLVTYGLIILGTSFFPDSRETVLKELRPGLWWGGIMVVAGAVLTLIGLKVHTNARKTNRGTLQ